MIACPILFSREQLDLAKDTLRRAIIQDMNAATSIIEAGTRARLSASAIRIAVEKNEDTHRDLLALLDHLNSFHFQNCQ
jgi:hypothetical protein